MYVLNRNTHTAPLFKNSNILKFPDKIALENCIFITTKPHEDLLKIGLQSLQIQIDITEDVLI